MTGSVVKFPYEACRRIHSRKPRRSKNGTPEERAAAAAAALPLTTATVIEAIPRHINSETVAPTPRRMRPYPHIKRGESDPVYAMIETHRSASIAYDKAVNHPAVGNSDHPQCAEKERISDSAQRELLKQVDRLFAFIPSTSAGVASLLLYISSLRDWQMPAYFSEEREIRGLKKLCKTMANALDTIGPTVPAPVDNTRDPILTAIEAHRMSYDEWQSSNNGGSDDETSDKLLCAADWAADRLLVVQPTTVAGAAALLAYFAEQTIEDETYFPERCLKDVEDIPFATALTRNLSTAMSKIATRAVVS
jgi:hypothetical protein